MKKDMNENIEEKKATASIYLASVSAEKYALLNSNAVSAEVHSPFEGKSSQAKDNGHGSTTGASSVMPSKVSCSKKPAAEFRRSLTKVTEHRKVHYVMRHRKLPIWELMASELGTNPETVGKSLIQVPIDYVLPWQVCVWFGYQFVAIPVPHGCRPTVAWLVRKAIARYISSYRQEPPIVRGLIKADGSVLLFPGFEGLKTSLREYEMMVAILQDEETAFKVWNTLKGLANEIKNRRN